MWAMVGHLLAAPYFATDGSFSAKRRAATGISAIFNGVCLEFRLQRGCFAFSVNVARLHPVITQGLLMGLTAVMLLCAWPVFFPCPIPALTAFGKPGRLGSLREAGYSHGRDAFFRRNFGEPAVGQPAGAGRRSGGSDARPGGPKRRAPHLAATPRLRS